jgi:hypothetical protein
MWSRTCCGILLRALRIGFVSGGRRSVQVASVVKGRILGFLIRSVTCRDRYKGLFVGSGSSISCSGRCKVLVSGFWFLVSVF